MKRRKQAYRTTVTPLPGGGGLLTVRRTVDGRRVRERFRFDSESQAAKAETSVVKRLDNGLSPFSEEQKPALGVAAVLAAYRAPGRGAGGLTAISANRIENQNRHLIRLLGTGSVAAMLPDDLFAYQAARLAEKVTVTTVCRELGGLLAACRAAKVNRRITGHPFELLDKQMRRSLLPQGTPKAREMPDADFEAIMGFISPAKYVAPLRFIRGTGISSGTTCAQLFWENVTKSTIEIPTPTKKRPAISVPLSVCRHLLPPHPIGGKGLIFPGIASGLTAAWARACKKAGLKYSIHEMGKHSAINLMFERGASIDEIGPATGTRAETIRRWYLHRSKERGTSAFERLAMARGGAVAKPRSQTGHGRTP